MPLSTRKNQPQGCVLVSTLQENADSLLPGETAPESIYSISVTPPRPVFLLWSSWPAFRPFRPHPHAQSQFYTSLL